MRVSINQQRASSLVAILGAAALAISGCGEKSFSAEDFVAEANSNGATLELGKPLVTDDEEKELYEVRLAPVPGQDEPAAAVGHQHSGGSLAVYDDGATAEGGVKECEAATDLLCYRAGNVVIVLEGTTVGHGQVALAAALKEMEDE